MEFVIGSAEHIPLAHNSIDTILVTYRLRTIVDVAAANRVIYRVLNTQ